MNRYILTNKKSQLMYTILNDIQKAFNILQMAARALLYSQQSLKSMEYDRKTSNATLEGI